MQQNPGTTEKTSDDVLVARAQAGDEHAVSELVERYAPRILRFGMKLCRDEEDAREVLQETLLAAARGLRSFRGQSRLVTWLYAIARSFCIKHRTRSGGGAEFEPLDRVASEELVIDAGKLPDEELARRRVQTALERAIRELESNQREVILLRDVEGLSAAETAEVLGVSVEAVKSRLHRARRTLRDRLVPLFGPAPGPETGRACPDVIELLSRHLEGEITPNVCRELEAHVADCSGCSRRCDSLRRVLSTCSEAPLPELTPELRHRVLQEMHRVLKEQDHQPH